MLCDFIATAVRRIAGTNPLAPQWPDNRGTPADARPWRGAGDARARCDDARASPTTCGRGTRRHLAAGPADGAGRLPQDGRGRARHAPQRNSALARVLNLCGAFLPPRCMPPSGTQNPDGILGAGSDRRPERAGPAPAGRRLEPRRLRLPGDGAIADEFETDARALLAVGVRGRADDPDQGSAHRACWRRCGIAH